MRANEQLSCVPLPVDQATDGGDLITAAQTLGIPHRMRCMRVTQGLALLLASGFGLMPILVYFLGDKLS